MIKIRKAIPEDAVAIATLMNLAMADITYQFIGKENPEEADVFLAHFVRQPGNQYAYEYIFVAEEDGIILGEISLYPGSSLHKLRQPILDKVASDYGIVLHPEDETQAGEIYIDTIAVHNKAQGKGIGKRLLEHAIKEFTIKQNLTLGLLVDKNNPNAKRLYEKVGFSVQNDVLFMGTVMEHMQLRSV